MKTSCSSWSYHRVIKEGRLDQMSWIRECAASDLDGVELLGYHFPSTDVAYLRSVRKLCADLHLTVAMVSAGGHLTTSDDAKRQKEVEDIGRWMDVAAYMGAPLIRFFCGKGAELDAGGPELCKKVMEAMRKVAAMGEQRGIVASLENHGGTTADQLLSLRKDVNSPWLAYTLDTGNFPPTSAVGPDTYASIERCAPFASIVHAKFFNVLEDGRDKDFDWTRIHGLLKKANFRGFLSVEYEGKDPDEIACMRRIARYLKTLR